MKASLLLFAGLLSLGFIAIISQLAPAAARQQARAALPPVAPQATVTAEPLPPGATDVPVLSGMEFPIAMAFDSAGRLFYTEKHTNASTSQGRVRLVIGGVLQPTPVITFTVDIPASAGCWALPSIPISAPTIISMSTTQPTPAAAATDNRVVRFVETTAWAAILTTIFTSPQTAGNHNGGNIHFGPDGKLYITIGDNANAANAQDVTVKNGKMHRINPDGTIPADNPVFTQTGALPSLYAMGLRNSFDFTFDPLSANASSPARTGRAAMTR